MADSCPAMREIRAPIEDERRDALLSALRRGRAAEALELLERWRPGHLLAIEAYRELDWIAYHQSIETKARRELGEWAQVECRLHVEAGRFQHALVLVERYAVLPPLFTRAEQKARQLRLKTCD